MRLLAWPSLVLGFALLFSGHPWQACGWIVLWLILLDEQKETEP